MGSETRHFAYPEGNFSEPVRDACEAAGYDAAYSACYRAVKEKYPDVTPIAVTDQPFSRHGPSAPVDLYGEHQRMSTTFAPTFSFHS